MQRIAILTLSLLAAVKSFAGETIVVGDVYPIAEPDILSEIKKKGSSVDWGQWMHRNNPEHQAAFVSVSLPRATESASFLFDPTYTLPRDIHDGKGGVLYPKGTKVNVYERITTTTRTIVVGPSEEDHKWLIEVAKPAAGDKVLLAGANVLRHNQRYKSKFYKLDQNVVDRFGLRAIPAIVKQENTMLRVTEYAVDIH